MKLRAATGAPILLNQNDYALLKMLDVQATWVGMAAPGVVEIDQSLSTGDTVNAGVHAASILHTPGHTEGSICLYFPAEKTLIAGDTLFAGSIGRTLASTCATAAARSGGPSPDPPHLTAPGAPSPGPRAWPGEPAARTPPSRPPPT